MSGTSNMAKKSRIIPLDKPVPVPKVTLPQQSLARKELFVRPLNVSPLRGGGGPSIPGYKCVAVWTVTPSDEQVLEFLEISERIGNVHKLYHGTPARNIHSIASDGLHLGSSYCMFGAGIYMGGPLKAINYARDNEACYLLEVEAALGKIKACENAEKHTLRRLQTEGFDSVGGFAHMTNSWAGKLRHDEYVVYDTAQVLVNRIFEYQRVEIRYDHIPTEGACSLIVEKDVALTAKNRAFRDVISKQPCGKRTYTRIACVEYPHLILWACKDCIKKFKLRQGSKIEIKSNSWKSTTEKVTLR